MNQQQKLGLTQQESVAEIFYKYYKNDNNIKQPMEENVKFLVLPKSSCLKSSSGVLCGKKNFTSPEKFEENLKE